MDHILEYIKKFPVEKTLSKTISIVVLAAICLFIVKMVLILFDKLIKKSKIDKLVYKILRVAVKSVLLFTLFKSPSKFSLIIFLKLSFITSSNAR